MKLSRYQNVCMFVEAYTLPEGITLFETPNIAPEGYMSIGGPSVFVPQYDDSGAPTSTFFCYLRKNKSEPHINGFEIAPIELTIQLTNQQIESRLREGMELLAA